jgi:deoxyribonuclease IV
MISASRRLLFGTAGVPLSTPASSTLAAIDHVKKLGLDGLEVEFVKGTRMGNDTAREIGRKAESLGIRLSVHAPYYINLNSAEPGKRLASQERLISSSRLAHLLGARTVVIHPGYYGQDTPEKAYENIKSGFREVLSILRSEKNPVTLRPETMGRQSQFGSLDETLLLCRELEGLLPCLDFSHIHARDQGENSYRYFFKIMRKVEKKLGRRAMEDLHVHVAGILYGEKGEIRHLDLRRSDFNYDSWVQVLNDVGGGGLVVCESPNLEKDALMLKRLYESYHLKSPSHR